MNFQNIEVIFVPVKDQEAAKLFYVAILGFEIAAEAQMGPNKKWIQLRLPNTETSISLEHAPEKVASGHYQNLVLSVENITDTIKSLTNKGIKTTPIEDTPFGKFTSFQDPDGNYWTIRQK